MRVRHGKGRTMRCVDSVCLANNASRACMNGDFDTLRHRNNRFAYCVRFCKYFFKGITLPQ